jgi:hypothetical protein
MIIIPSHNLNVPEAVIQRLVLAHVNTIPGVWVHRVNVGKAQMNGRWVKFGEPGQADISGLMGAGGRRLEIECKKRTGKQTPDQRKWQKIIEAHGGLYIIARSLYDAMVPVCRALDLEFRVEAT